MNGEAVRGAGVAVIIPALDEEESLPSVLAALSREEVGRILVVDNGSRDRTAAVAAAGGAEVLHEPRRGYGAACLAGIRNLQAAPPGILVFMDGDGSDDPDDLPALVAPVRSGEADLVVGVRGSEGDASKTAVPWHARLGNRVVLRLGHWLHGLKARDLGPFRAIRFDALEALEMDDMNWGWTLQMQIRAHHRGLKVKEVGVRHRPRAGGSSKVSGNFVGSVRAGAKMLLTLVTERRRSNVTGLP